MASGRKGNSPLTFPEIFLKIHRKAEIITFPGILVCNPRVSIFSFKIRMKHKFSLLINQNILKKIQISTVFLFYCFHTSFIWISVQLLIECNDYSNKHRIQSCGAYQRKYGRYIIIQLRLYFQIILAYFNVTNINPNDQKMHHADTALSNMFPIV